MDCLHNRDAELAIIGTALTDTECAIKLAAVPASFFTAADTRAAHKAVRQIVAAGGQCDLITVEAIACSEMANIAAMLLDCSTKGYVAMFAQYEELLNGCAKRRTLLETAKAIMADVNNPAADPDSLAYASITAIQGADTVTGSVSMEEALYDFVDRLGKAKENRCLTGIAALDRITGGFQGGQYIAVGARPGVGKSAFGLYASVNIARTRGTVLIVSLEMQPHEIAARQVSAESGVDGQDINSGDLTVEAYERMTRVYPEIARLPIRIGKDLHTMLQVRREAMRLKYSTGLKALVIDYIGLMDSDGKWNSRYEKYSDISRAAKILAKDLDVPVIVLTQMNRNSEAGKMSTKRPPTMADARDTGSIEQDADKFIILHSPEDAPKDEPGSEQWEAHCWCERMGWTRQWMFVEKNRSGRTGMATVGFDKAHMRYYTMEG